MIFYLVETLLLAALAVAGVRIVQMHRALEQWRAYHRDSQIALEKTASALSAARVVLSQRNADEYDLSIRLESLIGEARLTIDELDFRMSEIAALPVEPKEQIPVQIKEEKREAPIAVSANISTARPPRATVAAPSQAPFAFARRVGRPMANAVAEA